MEWERPGSFYYQPNSMSILLIMHAGWRCLNKCSSPKSNCSVGHPSRRFIILSVLYLVVLLPVISNGISRSPSLWGRFISAYERDEPAVGRLGGQEALPQPLSPRAAQAPGASTLGCPSWLGLHDPGSELGSASLSLGGRRCEQPPAFLPIPI